MTSSTAIRQIAVLGALLCAGHASPAAAQGGPAATPASSRIDLLPLHRGHHAVVLYDPAASGAAFSIRDSVFALITVGFADSLSSYDRVMPRVGGLFRLVVPVPPGAVAVTARFQTDHLDQGATTAALVYGADGKPVRGALVRVRGDGLTYADRVRRELAAYPDEYALYAEKWTYATAKADRDSVIRSDLRELTKVAGAPLPPVGVLFSLEAGAMALGDEAAARAVVKRMAKLYPRSPRTGDAVISYQLDVYRRQLTGQGPDEIESLKWALIRGNPASSMAALVLSENAADRTIPQSSLEPVARHWIAHQPKNPQGYLYLAQLLDAHETQARAGLAAADTALSLLFGAHSLLPRPIERYLPAAYQVAASLALRSGRLAEALGDIRAMQTLEIEPSADPYLLDAQVWSRAGDAAQAERSWVVAWQRGSAVAEDSLKALYQRTHASLDSFPAYVAARSDSIGLLGTTRPVAPDVRMVSLRGDTLNARTLAGKVVVLNFWYIGCIPCRVEMPSLNKLVADYQGKDVAFIAVAWDDAAALQAFLAKIPFNYTIVPNGKPLAATFGASLYPTHMVVGRDGRTDMRLVGEDSTHVPLLRLAIDRALTKK